MSDKVYIFDTTLRDGEQVPGLRQLNIYRKKNRSLALEVLGVWMCLQLVSPSLRRDFNHGRNYQKYTPTICALTLGLLLPTLIALLKH